MRFIKMLGLAAIAAVAAMALVGASSASAAAHYLQGGSPLNHAVAFTGTSGAGTLQTVGGSKVTCTSDHVKGTLLNSTEDEAEVTFLGCTGPFGASCTTAGQATRVILTSTLKSELVNLVGGGVGVLLTPKTAGGLFAEFSCLGVVIKVRGSLVGVATPVGVEQTTGTLTFTQSGGKQTPSKYELNGELKTAKLETSVGGGAFEESGESTTESLTFAQAVEVSE